MYIFIFFICLFIHYFLFIYLFIFCLTGYYNGSDDLILCAILGLESLLDVSLVHLFYVFVGFVYFREDGWPPIVTTPPPMYR